MQNENKMTEALQRTAIRSLETLCFAFSSPIIDEKDHAAERSLTIEVEFRGEHSGRLILDVYGDIVSILAHNMVGEGKLNSAQQRDAIGEIANVICGNFLPEAFGKGHVFEITAPRVCQNTQKHTSRCQVHLAVETGQVDVALFLDETHGTHSG